MGILAWIVFGALAGWIASMIAGTNDEQGAIGNILVGIAGAVIGGWIMSVFGKSGVSGFDLRSFLVAVAGAVAVLFIYKSLSRA